MSKSAAKAPIEPERRRRIVDIPRFFSRPIPPRDVFVADLDTPPPRTIPGASPAPPRARPSPPARRSGPTDRARGRRSKNPTAPESQYGRRTQWGPGSRPHQGNPSAKKAAGVGRDGGTAEGPDRDRVTRLTGAVPANRRSPEPACAMRARRDMIRLRSIRAIPPGAMRPEVTSPERLPQGRGSGGRRAGPRERVNAPRPTGRRGAAVARLTDRSGVVPQPVGCRNDVAVQAATVTVTPSIRGASRPGIPPARRVMPAPAGTPTRAG